MTDDGAQKQGRQRGRISRAQAAFYSGLVGGAVSVAAGQRLRQVFGMRGAANEFAGTPCSRLPAEGGGDPIGAPGDAPDAPPDADSVGDHHSRPTPGAERPA